MPADGGTVGIHSERRSQSIMDQQTCEKEWNTLMVKLASLSTFINQDPNFTLRTAQEQARLRLQLVFMREYANVLRERIDSRFA